MRYVQDQRNSNQPPSPLRRRPRMGPPERSFKPTSKPANFILIKLAPETANKSLEQLRKIEGISGFHRVSGQYDLVLIVRERNGFNKEALMKSISSIPGVIEVQALMAAS